jgi:hypothetical protein
MSYHACVDVNPSCNNFTKEHIIKPHYSNASPCHFHACVDVNPSCNDFTKEHSTEPKRCSESCVCFVNPSCNYFTKEQSIEPLDSNASSCHVISCRDLKSAQNDIPKCFSVFENLRLRSINYFTKCRASSPI